MPDHSAPESSRSPRARAPPFHPGEKVLAEPPEHACSPMATSGDRWRQISPRGVPAAGQHPKTRRGPAEEGERGERHGPIPKS